jgi:hypothetical protein
MLWRRWRAPPADGDYVGTRCALGLEGLDPLLDRLGSEAHVGSEADAWQATIAGRRIDPGLLHAQELGDLIRLEEPVHDLPLGLVGPPVSLAQLRRRLGAVAAKTVDLHEVRAESKRLCLLFCPIAPALSLDDLCRVRSIALPVSLEESLAIGPVVLTGALSALLTVLRSLLLGLESARVRSTVGAALLETLLPVGLVVEPLLLEDLGSVRFVVPAALRLAGSAFPALAGRAARRPLIVHPARP